MEDKQRGRDALSAMPSFTLRISNLVALSTLLAVKVAVKAGLFGKEYPVKALDTPLTPAGCASHRLSHSPCQAAAARRASWHRNPHYLSTHRWAFSTWVLVLGLQAAGTVYQLMPQGYTSDGSKQRIINTIGASSPPPSTALDRRLCCHSPITAWFSLTDKASSAKHQLNLPPGLPHPSIPGPARIYKPCPPSQAFAQGSEHNIQTNHALQDALLVWRLSET